MLNIEHPHEYMCSIRGFNIGHSRLLIYSYNTKNNNNIYIYFENVTYFDLLSTWQGLQINTAPYTTSIPKTTNFKSVDEVAEKVGDIKALLDKRVFLIPDANHRNIVIVAGVIGITYDIKDTLKLGFI